MSEADLIRRWTEEQPQYKAWGSFVVSEMQRLIGEKLQDSAVESFLRIPPKSRLKETPSLVDKAFNRGKPYADPYTDITDKVGVRFVVLLNEDIRIVEQLLCKYDAWDARKDKDYEQERNDNPLLFTYQSLHYIVFAKNDLEADGVLVKAGTPCEVQIRTLLQHAHSELSHSNLYKPNISATPDMVRAAARSMALIEAADDYFGQIAARTKEADLPIDEAKTILAKLYTDNVEKEPEYCKSATTILDSLRASLNANLNDELNDLLVSDGYVIERIKERHESKIMYRQPVILLLYLLVKNSPSALKNSWPFSESELRPLFVDMGVAFDNGR